MIYQSAKDWDQDDTKKVMLFGMSGLGKTHVSNMLRATGRWFHYSVDYRIGTRYMGEYILDNIKREALKNPFLRDLLMSDSIHIGSNISFDNLTPLSSYLGKPGDPSKGGIHIDDYTRRQEQHHTAERAALLDTPVFIERANDLYGYNNFICDTGGSICEVVNPNDPQDKVLSSLAQNLLPVWIEGSDEHRDRLIERFTAAPKPMCYQAGFLNTSWQEYLSINNTLPDDIDPDDYMAWAYAKALDHRQPIYASMAKNWGISVPADTVAALRDEQDFNTMIADALGNKAP